MTGGNIKFRTELLSSDATEVKKIIESTNFFRPDEIAVAVEIIEESIIKGAESGYEFIFAETEKHVIAYVCFGLIPCSLVSYDLYWIATDKDFQKEGVGKKLLAMTEEFVKNAGGRSIYIETSARPEYEPTRIFYLRNGYELLVQMKDFYDVGDDKVIYRKTIIQ
jgi:GNAT superfamily N-acetyltransferase